MKGPFTRTQVGLTVAGVAVIGLETGVFVGPALGLYDGFAVGFAVGLLLGSLVGPPMVAQSV